MAAHVERVATTRVRLQRAAVVQIAQHLDYLRDFCNLDDMTHEQIAEALVDRLAMSNLLKAR